MFILGIYKVALTHKKLGITKELLATKTIPFLFPLCIDSGLNLTQVSSLVVLLYLNPQFVGVFKIFVWGKALCPKLKSCNIPFGSALDFFDLLLLVFCIHLRWFGTSYCMLI